MNKLKTKEKEREIFADVLRTIAIIFVIIIHTTCTYLNQTYQTSEFKWVLIIDSIVCIAVPIFFMLSGCFLIKKENIIGTKNTKRILKKVFQLIFWTLIYLLFEKYYLGWDIDIIRSVIALIFKPQVGHLWFIYPLIALYILSPIVSKLYYSLERKTINYLLIFTFVVPLIIKTFIDFYSFVSIPLFAIGFSEFGYFILGKYIYDNISEIKKKVGLHLSVIFSLLGLVFVVVFAYYSLSKLGITNNPYFDYSRFPCALYCVFFFTTFVLLKDKLEKLPYNIKKIFSNIGMNSGGIYYIHMIFASIFSNFYILGIGFTSNEGNLIFMILGASFYFVLSWVTVNVFKKIPYIKFLFD